MCHVLSWHSGSTLFIMCLVFVSFQSKIAPHICLTDHGLYIYCIYLRIYMYIYTIFFYPIILYFSYYVARMKEICLQKKRQSNCLFNQSDFKWLTRSSSRCTVKLPFEGFDWMVKRTHSPKSIELHLQYIHLTMENLCLIAQLRAKAELCYKVLLL